jgi:hypothetical protein
MLNKDLGRIGRRPLLPYGAARMGWTIERAVLFDSAHARHVHSLLTGEVTSAFQRVWNHSLAKRNTCSIRLQTGQPPAFI